MQIFQKVHCIGIDIVKKEEEEGKKFEHSHIFKKDAIPWQFTGSAIKHKAKKLAPFEFTINYPLLIFNRLLLRSSGVLDFMTLLHFLSCFGLTLPGFHTSSDMYELSKSIC